jgi:hypothetical protein
MKFPQAKNKTLLVMPRIFIFMVCAALMAISVSAQKELVPENVGYDLDQCANGSSGILQCAGANWQNGNLNGQQAKYVEGESVPYRVKITGLGVGSTGNTVTLEWDTTESSGKHAIDYLTSFDRSIGVAPNHTGQPAGLPCDNAGFTCNPVGTTFPIPLDPLVATGGVNGPVTQVGGQFFTIYNGTITGATAYTTTGTYANASQTSIVLTFSATTENVVIAWGGHISTRLDWGNNLSAVGLNGSPYHMRILTSGNQDRSLSVDAVIYPAVVTVIKRVINLDGTFASTFAFGFQTTTGASTAFPANFTLTDSDPTSPGGASRQDTNVQLFAAANTITIVENQTANNRYILTGLTCTEVGVGLNPVVNTTWNLGTRTATIIPDEAESITCTFTNSEQTTTAAPSSISGRVLSSFGAGIGGVRVSVFSPATGTTLTRTTNQFGYYTFNDLETGEFYMVTVSSKRYTFSDNTRSFTLNDSIGDLDFTANP